MSTYEGFNRRAYLYRLLVNTIIAIRILSETSNLLKHPDKSDFVLVKELDISNLNCSNILNHYTSFRKRRRLVIRVFL